MSSSDFVTAIGVLCDLPSQLAALERQVAQLADRIDAIGEALPPRLASIKETAGLFGVAESTVRRWIADGGLPIVKVERTVRVDLSRLKGEHLARLTPRRR